MKAIVQDAYGPPEVLKVADVDRPEAGAGEILVRVRAVSVNPLDWHFMRGSPFLLRMSAGMQKPKARTRGVDAAGVVEEVGTDVNRLRPGDEVFGWCDGALAEYAKAPEENFVVKPARLSFELAAAAPVAAVTALQALRDIGNLKAGQKVLVNGAAGGVGSFAVQIARAFGAHVTGVCSTRNVEMVESLGADHVIDYTGDDFTNEPERYDLILDNAGNHTLSELRRVLTPEGTLILNSGASIGMLILGRAVAPFVRQRIRAFLAKITLPDLRLVSELLESGKVTPVIDRAFPLSQVSDAMRLLETGHARGKVVVTV